ncbi:MAG: hypothetical protein A4E42_00185 [Methanoregulaceae archaeon PtaU1.Bin222]|nr:MAG: hypothetical protein A4E42_00185 [Methanoregulaceae archaeon PtaU1.Bin222]
MTVPSSASWRSKVLIWLILPFSDFSHVCFCISSEIARLYQLRAKSAMRPRAGIRSQNRQRNGWPFSSVEGFSIECRAYPRGSSPRTISWTAMVMPDAFQPSMTMMTGTFRSRRVRWRTLSFSLYSSSVASYFVSSVVLVRSSLSSTMPDHPVSSLVSVGHGG